MAIQGGVVLGALVGYVYTKRHKIDTWAFADVVAPAIIMGQAIGRYELTEADVVIRPQTGTIGASEFEQKHLAIMEGEKAALAALPLIRLKLQQKGDGK